jgi:hypothetical protein
MFGVYSVKNFEYTKGDGDVVEFSAINSTAIAEASLGADLASDDSGNITVASGTNSFGKLLAVSADGKEIQVFIK